jgi:4-hydroxybenzoate polyprenyltransferase
MVVLVMCRRCKLFNPCCILLCFFVCRWAGQSLFGTLSLDIVVLTLLYSTAGLGIAIVNDFKSIEGDRAMGLQVFPSFTQSFLKVFLPS